MDRLYEQFEDAVMDEDYVAQVTEAWARDPPWPRHRALVVEFTVHATREPLIREALAKFYRRARTATLRCSGQPRGQADGGPDSGDRGVHLRRLLRSHHSGPQRSRARRRDGLGASLYVGRWPDLRSAARLTPSALDDAVHGEHPHGLVASLHLHGVEQARLHVLFDLVVGRLADHQI